jgi:hypothetical protein
MPSCDKPELKADFGRSGSDDGHCPKPFICLHVEGKPTPHFDYSPEEYDNDEEDEYDDYSERYLAS